jgi:threonine synthase
MTERAVSVLHCATCGATFSLEVPRVQCDACAGLLDVVHPQPNESGAELRRLFASRVGSWRHPDHSGVWRYRELVLGTAPAEIVSYPEGNTPLVSAGAVARWCGLTRLLLKHEGMNPTGSFKDRGMTVGITQARRLDATAVACASTGNTSASLAAYASRAGMRALVLVPAGQVALGKLTQTLAYGARTLVVRGDFDRCLTLVREAAERLGVYLLNSVNPFRLEGQKTIVLELLEQLDWEVPDWIVLPAGNLGNTAAFGKALAEAREWGLIDRVPKIAAIQAAGAAPFARSFEQDFAVRHRLEADTLATAIRIGDPASYDRAVSAIRLTDGLVTTVTDAEILEAKGVVDGAGVGCEPASAASVAGARSLVAQGTIRPAETVVAVLTGHVLKDPGTLQKMHHESTREAYSNVPIEIEPSLQAVERELRRGVRSEE